MPDLIRKYDPSTALLGALAVLAAAGCDTAPAPLATEPSIRHEVVDGVGGLAVEGLWGSTWPTVPDLVIDTVLAPLDGDALGLVAPLHGTILSDGRLVIGDVGTRRIWIGSHAEGWTAGPGPGSGPGELRSLGGVWPAGDGFVVHDSRSGDLVRFESSGRSLGRAPVGVDRALHGPGSSIGAWSPSLSYLGGGEWLAVVPSLSDLGFDGPIQMADAHFTRVVGHPADREIPLGSGQLRPLFVEGGGGAPVPFGRTAYAAGAAGGVVIFRGDDPYVEHFDSGGTVSLRIRWTDSAPPLTAAHRDALAKFMRASVPADEHESLEPLISSLQSRIPLPEHLPHLGDLRLGTDGAIWMGWPERSGLETPTEPELVLEWRVIFPSPNLEQSQVFQATLPHGTTLLGPVTNPEPGASEGSLGEGAFFVLLRDEMGRQGIGILRHGIRP